jgi:hypothetical protein
MLAVSGEGCWVKGCICHVIFVSLGSLSCVMYTDTFYFALSSAFFASSSFDVSSTNH